MEHFDIPAATQVWSPVTKTPVYLPRAATGIECRGCGDVWIDEVPEGHVCQPPLDPTLAWPA